MSFRAIIISILAIALLGCSHTIHYNYPPPHPPSQVLDTGSIQEPETPAEQPLVTIQELQIPEKPQETFQKAQEDERPVACEPDQETIVETETPGVRSPEDNSAHDANPQVQYWIERLSGRERRTFQSQLKRLDKIRPTMERIFDEHGLPKDLVYLCLVESGANAHAVSCSGATGYWQFIPDTAKKYGLQVNKYVDERKNLEKSTRAAAQYLKHLYGLFGDWYLSIAAYNAGEGAVMRLMKNEGIKTFWDIDDSMPIKTETIAYVPKYIATVTIAGDRETYGMPTMEPSSPAIPKGMDVNEYLSVMASADGGMKGSLAQTSPEIMNDANPATLAEIREKIRRDADGLSGSGEEDQASPIRYTIRKGDTLYSLAKKHSTTVKAIARANHLSEKQRLQVGKTIVIPSEPRGQTDQKTEEIHKVVKGETLEDISRKHGVPVKEIILANNIGDPRRIRPDMPLVIPSSQVRNASAGTTKYTVKKGDTLWGISRQFEVSSMDLMKWNKLTSTAQIRPGDELTIYRQ